LPRFTAPIPTPQRVNDDCGFIPKRTTLPR